MTHGRAKGLDHVAIAVKDLDAAVGYYVDVLGFAPPELEEVPEQQVRVAIFGHGLGRIELICPTTTDSGVAKFLDKRGEGLHHVCVEVADLEATLEELKAKGAQLIDQAPRPGAGGALVAFVHPRGAHGVLTELRQGPKPR
ncbi:MAG: methylmalonyl-CoA epimerase [Myxococcales bacterium]|nr:methylmalonyl-CoA epimerase [Myxococcales bacterium]